MNVPKKLKCLSLASLSSLVKCLRVRPEPNRMKHVSSAPLLGRPLASPANIRLGLKGLPPTSTLAYTAHSEFTKKEVCLLAYCHFKRLSFGRLSFGRLSFGRLSFGRLSFGRLSFGRLMQNCLMLSYILPFKPGSNGPIRNTFLTFLLIIEGATEKVLQFKMPFKYIYNKNFSFNEQKMYF